MSLILAPCQARGSVVAARRSLVTSHVSSHHAHRAVLVFARARMCGHFSLVRFIKCLSGKPQASFQRFPSHREICGYLLVRRLFPFFGVILLMGRCDLVYDDPRPCGDPDFLQSKRSLGGLIFGPCKFFVSVPRCFVTWGSDKFESVTFPLFVP